MNLCTTASVMTALSCLFTFTTGAENWPRFLGQNGQGSSISTNLPITISPDTATWKVNLGGEGHSSPIIWESTVYITAGQDAQRSLIALDVQDGTEKWRDERDVPAVNGHTMNGPASSTPTADENGVYTIWYGDNQAVVLGLTHGGKERWKREFVGLKAKHGPGGSPIAHENRVVIALEQEENDEGNKSLWFALDTMTGDTVWSLERKTESKASSSTPCLIPAPGGGHSLVFSSFSHGVTAVNPANGQVIWSMPEKLPARVVSSPVVAGDFIIATCGTGSTGDQLVAVEFPTSNNPARVAKTIEERFVPYCPTSIYAQGKLFLMHDLGDITCLDINTGDALWTERPAGKSMSSAAYADGKLYRLDLKGQLAVVRASDEYELLGVSELGEETQASPAIANNNLYLRTLTTLYCFAGDSSS